MNFRGIIKQSAASLLVSNGAYVYTFLCNVALMRMLLPEDFGTVALAVGLVGLVEIFTTFSFNVVMVQHRDSPAMLRAVFQGVMAVNGIKLGLAGILYLAVGDRYDPVIWQLFVLMTASKIFVGVGPLMLTRLEKAGAFLASTLISSGANALAVTLAVAAVWGGAGVYGLSLRVVLPPVLVFAAVMLLHPGLFPPVLRRTGRRQLRVVAASSTRLYFQRGAERAFERVPLLIIEALFGTTLLGLFSQATYVVTLLDRVTSMLNQNIALVFFAHNRRDAGESRTAFWWLLAINAVMAVPFVALLWIYPSEFVLILWDEAWLGVVPFLKVMAVMLLLKPVFAVLNSRLLGLRRNNQITIVFGVGFAAFAGLLLLVPASADSSLWVAGLTVLTYVIMIVVMQYFLSLAQRETSPRSEPS